MPNPTAPPTATKKQPPRVPFELNGCRIEAGQRALVELPLPGLYSSAKLTMPVHVLHGRRSGPTLFISAAVHGDEINGIEVIRQLLTMRTLSQLRGTLLALPVVNPYGLIHQSRYLPDRRDLNRSFPGSENGSLTGRVAHQFMEQIVRRCSHGIDLHTGALHRSNLPQIRANLDDPETERLARAFGVPVLLNAALRDGSLREAAAELGIPMLLYEAGEALRYDRTAIQAGVRGILHVMRALGMLSQRRNGPTTPTLEPVVARSSLWVRSPGSGMLHQAVALGTRVDSGDPIGRISDPFSGKSTRLEAPCHGVVIGRAETPQCHEGEALFHIARFGRDLSEAAEQVESFQQEFIDEQSDTNRWF